LPSAKRKGKNSNFDEMMLLFRYSTSRSSSAYSYPPLLVTRPQQQHFNKINPLRHRPLSLSTIDPPSSSLPPFVYQFWTHKKKTGCRSTLPPPVHASSRRAAARFRSHRRRIAPRQARRQSKLQRREDAPTTPPRQLITTTTGPASYPKAHRPLDRRGSGRRLGHRRRRR
jgi:hypothetical protein